MMAVYTKPIVMIDFETTGLSPDMGDRITEVAPELLLSVNKLAAAKVHAYLLKHSEAR